MDSMEVLINARSTRMDALCANLDSVLVELMECLDKLEVLRKRFSEAVSEGYFNLAKARYSMGPLSVNALHYDKVMSATCMVEVEPSSLNTGSGDETTGTSGAVFRICRRSTRTATESGLEGAQNGGREPDGENRPRRRRPQTGEPEPGEGVEEVGRGAGRGGEMEGEDTAERKPAKDPLNWFGILVPQSLRNSQKQFIHATTLCGELATVQSRLIHLRHQYSNLLLKKQNFTSTT